jgi:hypothetical protein
VAALGCTNPAAPNFDVAATADDGSCVTACRNGPLPLVANVSNQILDFSGGYAPNSDCGWRVECNGGAEGGGGGQAAFLHFLSFTTEANFDYVSLADGGDDAVFSGQLSGSALPQNFVARNGSMVVAFYSDDTIQDDGFVAEYWCADAAAAGCTNPAAFNFDPVATDEDGSCITACHNGPLPLEASASPQVLDFSGGYMAHMDCAWQVKCGGEEAAGRRALFHFVVFGTESNHEYVSMAGGGGAAISGKLSGSALPGTFVSQDGSMAIVFHSDYLSSTTGGFVAEYWCAVSGAGCTDPAATNFDPAATTDDGSCVTACHHGPLPLAAGTARQVLDFTGGAGLACEWEITCGDPTAVAFVNFSVPNNNLHIYADGRNLNEGELTQTMGHLLIQVLNVHLF